MRDRFEARNAAALVVWDAEPEPYPYAAAVLDVTEALDSFDPDYEALDSVWQARNRKMATWERARAGYEGADRDLQGATARYPAARAAVNRSQAAYPDPAALRQVTRRQRSPLQPGPPHQPTNRSRCPVEPGPGT